jgi:hypothetical protein
MNSGRDSGLYWPPAIVSIVGSTQPSPAVDLEDLQLVLVLLGEGVAHVAQGALRAGDAGHDLVVVGRGLHLLRALLGVRLQDLLGEVVVRPGLRARREEGDLLVGEALAQLGVVADLRVRRQQLLELLRGDAVVRELQVLVGHDGQAVDADLDLDGLDVLAWQASYSSASMAREASAMTTSPRQKRSKPSPVPAPPT